MSDAPELKPCPFCGSEAELRPGEMKPTLEEAMVAEKNARCSQTKCLARYVVCSVSEWNMRPGKPGKPTDLDVLSIKAVLFKMTIRIINGQFDSRSFIGDTALELTVSLYEDEKAFWTDYDIWEAKQT